MIAIPLRTKAFAAVQVPDSGRRRPWYARYAQADTGSSRTYVALKRTLDVAASAVTLPVVLPLVAVCAVLVKLDSPGPVFFPQMRTGKGGKRFRMMKLRTMRPNAEELKQQYMHMNELTYPDFKIQNDPRMTRIGRFLRRSSLDELPQVLNILRGEMSLVGPRPTSFASCTYQTWHTARLELQPGLTGLWQVSGRNDLDFDDRVRLDIAYCRNRSLWLDLRILARTVGAVVTARGAA